MVEPFPTMRTGAGFKTFLAALREIGWREWDPIGLAADLEHCEDEYDSYLLAAAGKLANGQTYEQVADYLAHVECDYMGLPKGSGLDHRALATVRQIAALVARMD